ncbi:MAG: hypothetical protein GF317_15995 [Candidatus Lokiarchaeota archaeon]|nr:hypothetical protein [Candidatus Lokiarchaeota archaeon]MBD3201045.1 hypothetical protein [Candidatus Lokiarchaeota archaeon]
MKKSTIYQIVLLLVLLVGIIITVVIAALFGIPIIALDKSGVSTAAFDFWSIGHLLVGLAIFIFAFTIGFIHKNVTAPQPNQPPNQPTLIPPDAKDLLLYWVITLITAVVWELVENTLLYLIGVKTKFDSPINISTDILLWCLGGLGSWYITQLMFISKDYIRVYYIYGIINLLMGVVIFIVFGYLTLGF